MPREELSPYAAALRASSLKWKDGVWREKGADPEALFNRLQAILPKPVVVRAKECEYGRGTSIVTKEYLYSKVKVEGDWGGWFEKNTPSSRYFVRCRKGYPPKRLEVSSTLELVFHLLDDFGLDFEIAEV